MEPKTCECGLRARCVDCRQAPNGWRRRYHCACGKRWSTLEIRVEDPAKGKTLLLPEANEAVRETRRLIARLTEAIKEF